MTNAEKFKTAEERAKAFDEYCNSRICNDCPAWNNDDSGNCRFSWLDLEAEEEKPLPCPFCGGGVDVISTSDINLVSCAKGCGYYSQRCESTESAVAAHNRVARAVMEANGGEE